MAVRIFISYSHKDAKYLKPDSLLGHLQGLHKHGVEFWYDKNIKAGYNWDNKIKGEISKADIALVLVSQMFLNSKYCMNNEIRLFLRKHRESGLLIFPVILSACDWKQYDWLSSRQFLPGSDKTIEEDFITPGKRKRIFQNILEELRGRVNDVVNSQKKSNAPEAMHSASKAINTINKMVPEIKSFSYNQPEVHKTYGLLFEGDEKTITAVHNGVDVKTITAKELKKLPRRQLAHINIFQNSLENDYKKWERLYNARKKQNDRNKKKKIDLKIREIVADMREALDRIFAFLDSAGLQLDDHYLEFRHVIDTESKKAV